MSFMRQVGRGDGVTNRFATSRSRPQFEAVARQRARLRSDHIHARPVSVGQQAHFRNDANRRRVRRILGPGPRKNVDGLVFFTLGTAVGAGASSLAIWWLEGQHSHGGELGHMRSK